MLFSVELNKMTIYSPYFRRAKEKRLKKDAGRTRWSQYFRSMKGSSSPRLDKLLDKDELKVDLDSFSHGNIFFISHFLLLREFISVITLPGCKHKRWPATLNVQTVKK